MKNVRKEAQEEFLAFLKDFQLSDVVNGKAVEEQISKAFKQYYAILLLEASFAHISPWQSRSRTEAFHLYLRETISDICQSMILAASGFYKPSQLTLRSGLENWTRCIGLSADQNVLALHSVFELMDLVRSLPVISSNQLASNYFGTLRNRYSLLCGYVHTSSASHMALTTFANAYPRYLKPDASETFKAIEEVCNRITCLFCVIAEKTYRSLHHRHFDIVSDALPKKLKASLNS